MTNTTDDEPSPRSTSVPSVAPAPTPEKRGDFIRSPAFKFFTIAALSVLLLIPMLVVSSLTSERVERSNQVARQIATEWGREQRISGPILVVPFTREFRYPGEDRVTRESLRAVFAPDIFEAVATPAAERRRIAIFDTIVYRGAVRINARFAKIDMAIFGSDVTSIEWEKAELLVGVSDNSGLEEASVAIAGTTLDVRPGLPGLTRSGVNARLPSELTAQGAPRIANGFEAVVQIGLRGSTQLLIAPIGQQSTVRMTSLWPHPSFQGRLPAERTVSESGFDAVWRVPFIAQNNAFPYIAASINESLLNNDAMGVRFKDPIDHYALVNRAMKYSLMFVAAIFGIVFVLEILSIRRIHPVQYAMVGLLLMMFYMLLLSLSEHVGFALAFAAASAATGSVVAVFVGLTLESRWRGIAAAMAFTLVFGSFYLVMTLEDMALPAGAVTGFALLTVVLFATRRVNWSGALKQA